METYQMTAKTLSGLESQLAKEIQLLGGKNITKAKRAVYFEGDDELMMRANLCLRTAIQILVPWAEFIADDENELYDEVFALPWQDIFTLKHTFSVQASVGGGIFTHSKYIALKTKDAIADKFRKVTGKRPNVDTLDADYQINVHIQNNKCILSLNSTGKSLDRRGYRLKSNEAPLNEVLAAGIILMSNWNGETDFYDPMSGSGTFGIEAAMIAANIPPGLNRSFSFQHWSDHDENLYNHIVDDLKSKIRTPKAPIYCADLSNYNTEIIFENAERAKVEKFLSIGQADFFASSKKSDTGIVFLNPPYGERMDVSDIKAFYKSIGDQLKQEYKNCEAWFISSNVAAVKAFGLKPESRTQVFNGGMECLLQHYKLF